MVNISFSQTESITDYDENNFALGLGLKKRARGIWTYLVPRVKWSNAKLQTKDFRDANCVTRTFNNKLLLSRCLTFTWTGIVVGPSEKIRSWPNEVRS